MHHFIYQSFFTTSLHTRAFSFRFANWEWKSIHYHGVSARRDLTRNYPNAKRRILGHLWFHFSFQLRLCRPHDPKLWDLALKHAGAQKIKLALVSKRQGWNAQARPHRPQPRREPQPLAQGWPCRGDRLCPHPGGWRGPVSPVKMPEAEARLQATLTTDSYNPDPS